jgi:hypothetical protein
MIPAKEGAAADVPPTEDTEFDAHGLDESQIRYPSCDAADKATSGSPRCVLVFPVCHAGFDWMVLKPPPEDPQRAGVGGGSVPLSFHATSGM